MYILGVIFGCIMIIGAIGNLSEGGSLSGTLSVFLLGIFTAFSCWSGFVNRDRSRQLRERIKNAKKKGKWRQQPMQKTEVFYNNNGEQCIVLKRFKSIALIVKPESENTPYVVPVEHVKGTVSWWGGRYFADLESAYNYWRDEVKYIYGLEA